MANPSPYHQPTLIVGAGYLEAWFEEGAEVVSEFCVEECCDR